MLTVEDAFANDGIGFYSNIETKDTVLELWGASTKHPDVSFSFSAYKDRCEWLTNEWLIFQWLVYCASKLSFPSTTLQVVEFAQLYYLMLEKNKNKGD